MAKPNDKPAPVPAKAPRDLQLLIKPVSGRCNLACEYCFYKRVQESLYPDATVMSGEVLEAMIGQLLGLRLAQTSFSWQGGEPTLAGLDFFKEAVRLMMKHGRDGQSVGNAFQTNGILIDDRWSDFLTRYHFLVGISIDGPPEVHNRFRGKTFDRAMRGARTAVKLGVDVNILSCVSSAAEGRATELYEFLRGEGLRRVARGPGAGVHKALRQSHRVRRHRPEHLLRPRPALRELCRRRGLGRHLPVRLLCPEGAGARERARLARRARPGARDAQGG
jgi:sulfatase maturation enzyme AslB (radical SAM superfamily)